MIRLYFYVEGQTEQGYVDRVLIPYLAAFEVYGRAILAASGRKHGQVSRGGGNRYQPMRKDFGNLLQQHKRDDVRFTTMFDLYALHHSFPGWDLAEKQRHIPRERVLTLERAFADDVNDPRFIPHIQLHEFETILLCDPDVFAEEFPNAAAGIAALQDAVAKEKSPELINDGPTTAPSKRIIKEFPDYASLKTTVGVDLATLIGLDKTRLLCPHFDNWIKKLESLSPSSRSGTRS